MRTLLASLLLILAAISMVHAELFKWKDADGNIIYSDQPPPGHGKKDVQVDKEELPQIISVPAPEIPDNTSTSSTTEQKKESYKSISITEPVHDTAVRENSGKVTISVDVDPYIFVERGHMLIIFMDGIEVSKGVETSVVLDNVDRGTHTLKAQIVNSRGAVIKETGIISFTLQRFHI